MSTILIPIHPTFCLKLTAHGKDSHIAPLCCPSQRFRSPLFFIQNHQQEAWYNQWYHSTPLHMFEGILLNSCTCCSDSKQSMHCADMHAKALLLWAQLPVVLLLVLCTAAFLQDGAGTFPARCCCMQPSLMLRVAVCRCTTQLATMMLQ
jgi:hypothetical protein